VASTVSVTIPLFPGGQRWDCPRRRYFLATLPTEDALPGDVITMTDPLDHDAPIGVTTIDRTPNVVFLCGKLGWPTYEE
jgi:hypothetical protein